MNPENPPSYEAPPPEVISAGQTPARAVFHPYTTYVLIAICVIIYLVQLLTQSLFNVDIPVSLGVKANSLIQQGQVWRLITPAFLHGSILHIAVNMYAMFAIGPTLERFYGRWRFLALFLLSGYAGNVVSFMFSPYPSLGASTAIFGMLGAEGVLIYQNREVFGSIARRALTQVVMIAAINLIIGMTPGIDNWGHIGGLIGGSLFAWFAGPLLRKQVLFQTYAIRDVRSNREVIIAGIGVFALFSFLAIAVTFLRVG
jgi:rhomboid protease GluP